MADLGDLIGSLMVGLIRARRMADEQTAALAEYYKDNPLLEGLSVPRIRVPELIIEMPFLIEDHAEVEIGELEDVVKIAESAISQLKSTLAKNNIQVNRSFHATFSREIQNQLALIKQSRAPIMRETIARSIQTAFAETLIKTKTVLTAPQKEIIVKELRTTIPTLSITKEPFASSVVANAKTSDVKEGASNTTVVRLKITLKEEGLEWTTQVSETGGVIRTLQPE